MKFLLSILFGLILTMNAAFAQKTFTKVSESEIKQNHTPNLPKAKSFFDKTWDNFEPLVFANLKQTNIQLGSPIQVVAFSPQGKPTWVKGSLSIDKISVALEDQVFLYLEELKDQMGIKFPMEEFRITRNEIGRSGKAHIRMEQSFNGLPIHGSEIILHAKEGVIESMNGQYQSTPNIKIIPTFSKAAAVEGVKLDLGKQVEIIDWNRSGLLRQVAAEHQVNTQLVIYYMNENAKLAWHIEIHPNITEQWQYIVDAHTGAILDAHISSCKFAHDEAILNAIKKVKTTKERDHSIVKSTRIEVCQAGPLDGSLEASGIDLNGFLRNFKTYRIDNENTNFLIDATTPMFNSSSSNMPDEPVGAIFTINGNNGSPQSSNFQIYQLTDNNTDWTDAKAVSAHFNAGLAYEYYKNTFNRNSINGIGGTIYSIINVSDENGQSMDNAFWNGTAMFYGNGDQAFKPLAGALDVAGHEISHGVISNTANLVYQGESGALNESFADIFGAMVDRDDWQMGEDVVTNAFPSGALRDLQNPHNGGGSLSDPGYQPAHVNEQYHGSQDNGGVHINSGITNKAYYLFATQVGKEKAEQIYYKALKDYLTKSSQFKDLRLAVLSAAEDLHGASSNEVTKIGEALDAVGITGPSTGGGGSPGSDYQDDLLENPGQDFIVSIDKATNKLSLADGGGNVVSGFESTKESISQPSVTDDGTAIYYVAVDKKIRKITFDWVAETYSDNELNVSGNADNANVAVSPDGLRIAAVEDKSNIIYIYNFSGTSWKSFELYNPTNTQGVTTDNVLQADVLYFDYAGEYLMYDALSVIKNNQGNDVEYWDIGVLHVRENGGWADGSISKLFSGLPENTSVGNPTFAKISPFIIAFDYQDSDGKHTLVGANIETGNTATIATNDTWSRPSFSPNDQFLLADTKQSFGGGTDIVKVPLAANKYEFLNGGNVTALLSAAGWGNWFANGTRSLVIANEELLNDGKISISPNPFTASLMVSSNKGLLIHQIELFDLQGRIIYETKGKKAHYNIDLSNQAAGLFIVKVLDENGDLRLFKVIKQ